MRGRVSVCYFFHPRHDARCVVRGDEVSQPREERSYVLLISVDDRLAALRSSSREQPEGYRRLQARPADNARAARLPAPIVAGLCGHLSILSSRLGVWAARRRHCNLLIMLSVMPLFGAACQPRLRIIRSKSKLRTPRAVDKCQR